MKSNTENIETIKHTCSCYDTDYKKQCKLPAMYKCSVPADNRMFPMLSSYEYLCSYHFQYYHPHLLVSGFSISKACDNCGSLDCNGDCTASLISNFMER